MKYVIEPIESYLNSAVSFNRVTLSYYYYMILYANIYISLVHKDISLNLIPDNTHLTLHGARILLFCLQVTLIIV